MYINLTQFTASDSPAACQSLAHVIIIAEQCMSAAKVACVKREIIKGLICMHRDIYNKYQKLKAQALARYSDALVLSNVSETECESIVNKHLQHRLTDRPYHVKKYSRKQTAKLKNVYYVDQNWQRREFGGRNLEYKKYV